MDRRAFLGTVAGSVLAAPLDEAAAQATNTPRIADRGGPRVPVNFAGKVKGVNLTSKPGAPAPRAYWTEWEWSGWIRPQIDCAIALGANAIRIIGDVAMVLNGGIRQATYNARLQQLMSYCAENRLSLYYTGCSPYDTNGADNGTIAAYNSSSRAFIGVLASNVGSVTAGSTDYTSSILGCDLVQEANAWGNTAAMNAIYAALRPLVPPAIPCTFSASVRMQDSRWIESIAASCDFLDYHIYPLLYGIDAEPTAATLSAVRAAYPDRDILFGEGGIDSGAYSAGQVEAWIHGLINIADSMDSRGAMLWAAQDQDQPYGAFDSRWNPRASIAGPWLKWCRLSYLPPPRGSREGATIPPAASINAAGGIWTLGETVNRDKQVLLNGASAAGGQAVLLSWKNGQIKAQNSLGAWWLWSANRWLPTTPP
jgi:hypothetical protein